MRFGVLMFLLIAACSREPIPTDELLLEVSIPHRKAKLGAAFPLEVRRVWRSDAIPSIWFDDMLAPLRLELLESDRRENDTHTEEVRRYRARAFLPGALTIAGLSFRSRRGTAESEVFSKPLDLEILGEIDPERPGAIERPELSTSKRWIWMVALAVALLVLVTARRKRASPLVATTEEAATRPAHETALAQLAAIADSHLYRDAMPILREFLSTRYSFDAHAHTSQELSLRFPTLQHALTHSIVVRFGGKSPSDQERTDHRADLERAIRELA